MGQLASALPPTQPPAVLRSKTSAPIEKLNADTILAILQVVDEFDLLRLRLANKWLNHFTRDHLVWKLAFARVLERFQVPVNSLPVHPISATALEKLACRPTQFERYILRSPESSPPLRLARCLKIPLPTTLYNRAFHLLPGGRWLLTGDNSGIRIFDLCTPAEPEETPLPCVASLSLDCEITGVQMQAQASREAVTLLVSSEGDPARGFNDKRVRWQVITVKFNAGGVPSFHRHGQGVEVKHAVHGNLCGDFIALPHPDGSILIWNWVSDEWLTIVDKEHHSGANSSRDQRIFIDAPHCVCTDMFGGTYSILRIPMDRFVPRQSGAEPPLSPAQVLRDQELGGPTSGIFSGILHPASSFTHTNGAGPSRGHFLLSRRQVVFCAARRPDNPNDDEPPSFGYACHTSWERGSFSGTNRAVAQTTINGYPFVAAYRPDISTPLEIHAVVPKSNTPHSTDPTLDSLGDAEQWTIKSSLLPLPWDVDSTDAFRVLVCPMSAQIVMIHPDGKIYVFDLAS